MFSLPLRTEPVETPPHHPILCNLCTVSLGLSSLKVKATFLKVYFTSAVQVHASAHREQVIFLLFSPCLALVRVEGHKAG